MNGISTPSELLSLDNTDILLLGEQHTKQVFGEFIRSQLEAFDPDSVCVESCPSRYNMHRDSKTKSSVGTTIAFEYLTNIDNSEALYLLDQDQSEFLEQIQFGGLPETDSIERDEVVIDQSPLQIDFDRIREKSTQQRRSEPAKWGSHFLSRSEYMAVLLEKIVSDGNEDKIAVVTGINHTVDIYDILTGEKSIKLTDKKEPRLTDDRVREL